MRVYWHKKRCSADRFKLSVLSANLGVFITVLRAPKGDAVGRGEKPFCLPMGNDISERSRYQQKVKSERYKLTEEALGGSNDPDGSVTHFPRKNREQECGERGAGKGLDEKEKI